MERLDAEEAAADQVAAGDEHEEQSARDRVRERRNARKRKRAMRTALIALAIIGILVGSYAVGFSYFSNHYFPGTQVVGIDAAGMTEEELSAAIEERVQSYTATVHNDAYKLVFSGSDVGFSCDAHKVAKDLMTFQDASSWPAGVLGMSAREEADLFTYDATKLATLVNESVATYNKGARQPVAATLVLNKKGDGFTIKAEKPGTALEATSVLSVAEAGVAAGETEVILSDEQLVPPAFLADGKDTKAALERANDELKLSIPLVHGEEVVKRVKVASIAEWLTVDDDLTLNVSKEDVSKWADEELWQSADYADDTNVYVLDTTAFADALGAAVKTGTDDPVQLPYVTNARYLTNGGSLNPTAWNADLGRYIDVDKNSQTACLYDATGRVLWETPVTTGNEAGGRGTPVGEFGIYDKKTDFVLIGFDEDYDGKPDYEHHVDYWMPFFEGIGLHDASWRSVYGGSEYLERGSGGCVNLPRNAAAALYAMTHVNEVVVVHT